ncbi:hypothetical protein F2Q69_00005907 [Brassica cretica]|uniref:Uncharacterized protein n=1 Tax=Brassica cretica TaxID=69181 RepID=A0A8S9NYH4_BRACR|nr:hypothetical protein F2Q69_00005907 [Brassica cretica]
MEDMDFGQTSIDKITTTSSDVLTETSVDAILQTSVDESTETSIYDTPPEAGKFSLTNHANEEVVLDTASEGSFSTRSPEEAKRLIKK